MTSAKTPEPLPEDDQEPTSLDDLARQRHRLVQLLGRMLARRWLREQQKGQEPDINPASPDPR